MDAGADERPRPNRVRWWVAGVAVVVMLVVGFAIFRPDTAFRDEVVADEVDQDVLDALQQPSPDGATAGTPETDGSEPSETVLGSGTFIGQAGHSVSGRAAVTEGTDGRQLVLVDLDSDNGPDLKVYLSPSSDGEVAGGIELAPLKGNKGTQTYSLPPDVDLAATPNVVIWCKRFSTPFGTASLEL